MIVVLDYSVNDIIYEYVKYDKQWWDLIQVKIS